jgi:plastocyanin
MAHRRNAALRGLSGAVFAVALGLLTACGGGPQDSVPGPTVISEPEPTLPDPDGDTGQTSAAGSEVESLTATQVDFDLTLDEDSLSPGAYEIRVVNEGGSTHDLVVERDGETVAASDAIDPGRSTTFTVPLEPGEYVFYCSIADHRSMGMETTVRVG